MVEDVTSVDVGSFVLVVVLAGPHVPLQGFLVFLKQLEVHSDVVVARCVLRGNHRAFLVPRNRSSVLLLSPTVTDTDLIGHPHVVRKFLSHYL